MKLDDKRKVIEVLLCGASIGCTSAAFHLGYERTDPSVAEKAIRARGRAQSTPDGPNSFMRWGIEAAYRLIESSPTLVREWFTRSP